MRTRTAPRKPKDGADLLQMRRPPTHPGEIFDQEYLRPSGLSLAEVARRMGISPTRLNGIVSSRFRLSAEAAVLMGALTGRDPRFWLQLQTERDLWFALHKVDTSNVANVL
jgi:addiction module HigA family antidote